MRTTLVLLAASLAAAPLAPGAAQAKVHIAVDLDAQTMHVEGKDAGGKDKSFAWKVSSGKPGFETPAGTFKVLWMDKDHHSDTYEQAWMPNAIFFAPGYAIHGFGKSPWGHKASHGCIRLPAAKAEVLFEMVKAEGADIEITGESPVVAPTVASVEAARARKAAADEGGPLGDDGRGGALAPGYGDAPQAAPPRANGFEGVFSGLY